MAGGRKGIVAAADLQPGARLAWLPGISESWAHIRLLKNPVQRASLRPDRSLAAEE